MYLTRLSLVSCVIRYLFFFFFFKQKTSYDLRISDWSSDVCSSDLGPIVTTRSVHDTAVGKYYPMGARLSGSRTLAELPKYGGVGSFGLQGLGSQAHDL